MGGVSQKQVEVISHIYLQTDMRILSPLLPLSLLIFASSARRKGERHLHPYRQDEYGYHTNKITGCRIATA